MKAMVASATHKKDVDARHYAQWRLEQKINANRDRVHTAALAKAAFFTAVGGLCKTAEELFQAIAKGKEQGLYEDPEDLQVDYGEEMDAVCGFLTCALFHIACSPAGGGGGHSQQQPLRH